MKLGCEGFWIDLPIKDGIGQIKACCQKAIKKIDENRIQKLKVGLVLQETGLVYQRGIVRISLKELSQTPIPLVLFRRPLLEDIFGEKVRSATEEKTWEESEDSSCDVYLY